MLSYTKQKPTGLILFGYLRTGNKHLGETRMRESARFGEYPGQAGSPLAVKVAQMDRGPRRLNHRYRGLGRPVTSLTVASGTV